MASKQSNNLDLPKSTGKSSLETRASVGSTEVDVGGPKHSYWQSFIPQQKRFVKNKLSVLWSQRRKQ